MKFNISNSLIYPLSIDKIRFFVFGSFKLPVKLVVYDLDGVTPLWNSSTLWPRSLPANGEWIEVDCGLVVHRDFYIALVYSTGVSGLTFLGVDTAPLNGHDYQGPPMQAWQEGNWMIRAVVSEVPIGGHLVDSTFAVNFLPTALFLVPIVALSAYLLLNRRKIRM